MRKIETAESIERKRKRNTMIVGVVMLLILVFSTVGYSVLSRPDDGSLSGEETLRPNEYDVNGQRVIFSYSKEEVIDTQIDITKSLNEILSSTVYVASQNDNVFFEIQSKLGLFAKIQRACYGACKENLPEKNCSDNLIVWRDNSENKVTQEENCIFIDGDLKTVDAFLYKIFGL